MVKIISRSASTFLAAAFCALNPARAAAIADPITPDHPLWAVPPGVAIVDGSLSDSDWLGALKIVRTQAWRAHGDVTIRMMYSPGGIYLSAEVADSQLWADGIGSGGGNRWEVETDDSMTFYFDPDNSRDEFFSDGDRAFGVNLGNPGDPINGVGKVRRWKYVKGTGDGGAPDAIPGGDPAPGTQWATVVEGTVNDDTDTDTGWVTEIFLPWSALSMNPPVHGQTIGMNFDVIFDNDGGLRNLIDNREGPNRFVLPAFVDDHVQGAHSSYASTLAGTHGPVNYAELMFVEPGAVANPEAIDDLAVEGPSAYGVRLIFTAPAGTTWGAGHVSSYEIRYDTDPIASEGAWDTAWAYPNAYVPRLSGLPERLRIAGLSPSSTYHVAVRGRDSLGNLGPLSNSPSFTTAATSGPGDRGRIIPAPDGSMLIFENGTPFVLVGEHHGISWGYFRNLYPGDVWDPFAMVYHDFNTNPSFEGEAGPHLDLLASAGVNTMRLYLETLDLDQTGNPETPRGRYWIEFPAGVFNADMKQYVLNSLEEAASRDMYLILAPFDTGRYDEAFAAEIPYYVGNGGPLTSINDFFQNPQTLEMAKARMREVIDWVEESPHGDHVLGWDPMSEWDSFEWTLNSEGDGEAGRETEMRTRAQWMTQLNEYIRQQDPDHLLFTSTTVRDPRGPLARALLYERSVDALAPHLYTNSNEEPLNNPDVDRKVLPAVENALLTNYWLSHRNDTRPILNGEWGMNRPDWPGGLPQYGPLFTQAEDEAVFRTVLWSGLATGQLGTGLRIATDELSWNLFSLTDPMRDVELTFSRFVQSTSSDFRFSSFAASTLVGRIQASSGSAALLSWGVADEAQGIAYVLQDGNQTTGSVADGQLHIEALPPNTRFDVEIWATHGGATSALSSRPNLLTTSTGTLTIELPTFTEDLAIKFVPEPRGALAHWVTLAALAGLIRQRRRG